VNDNKRGLHSHIHTGIARLQLSNESKTFFFDVCQNGCIRNGKTRGNGTKDFLKRTPLRHFRLSQIKST